MIGHEPSLGALARRRGSPTSHLPPLASLAPPPPAGAAVAVSGTLIAGNSFTGSGAGTRATLTLAQTAATAWSFDFCDRLVFPRIARVEVGVVAAVGFPRAVARPPQGCTVLIETDVAVTGNVTVTVDSSDLSADFI